MAQVKTFVIQVALITVGLVCALGINYLYAWTGPTGTAPNNNVSSPLNVGTTAQVKDGNLSVGRSTNTVSNVGFSVIGSSYIDGWLKLGDGATGAAAQPLELVGTAGTHGIRFPDGTTQTTAASGGLSTNEFLHVVDQKSSGTDGQTMSSGSWVTRQLNTTRTNTISGASLSSNRFTLPAGTYYIEASAPVFKGGTHTALLYNVTTASNVIIGTSESADATNDGHSSSFVSGVFTTTATNSFEIRHRIGQSSKPGGRASGFGVSEIYTDVKVWKVN